MSAALPCESLDDLPRLSKKDNRVYKCTLCSDRVAVGQEPACVKTCPTGAIVFGTKEKMIEHAGDRILLLQVKDGRITWPTDAAALRKTPDWAKPILEAALSQAR